MLLKEFPEKKSILENREQNINNKINLKKAKNNLLKNLIIAVFIIAISFFIPNPVFMLLCISIAFYPLSMSAYSYRYIALLDKKDIKTYVYDDKIEHFQYNLFLTKLQKITINYDDVKSSTQDLMGNIIVTLKNDNYIISVKTKKSTQDIVISKSNIKLNFVDSNAKYYLIKRMSFKMKYK